MKYAISSRGRTNNNNRKNGDQKNRSVNTNGKWLTKNKNKQTHSLTLTLFHTQGQFLWPICLKKVFALIKVRRKPTINYLCLCVNCIGAFISCCCCCFFLGGLLLCYYLPLHSSMQCFYDEFQFNDIVFA